MAETDHVDYAHALAVALEAAREAGEILRADFDRPGGPRGAGSHADADGEAEAAIRARLLGAFPEHGYLGEETGPVPAKDGQGHVWLVDPNDGTAAYLKGYRGSAVSIGLLRDGLPVLGVVYAYAAPDHGADLLCWAEGCGPLLRNGWPVEPRAWTGRLGHDTVVAVSQTADTQPETNASLVSPGRYLALPSVAYRLALAAAGEVDCAVALSGPCGWDYGAGHALLRAAGGTLLDESGDEIRYSREGRSQARWCFGGAPAVARELSGRSWERIGRETLASEPYELATPRRGAAITSVGSLSRAHGCLLGQLAGDALGSLVEFQSAARIAGRYPEGPRLLADGGTWDTIAGQPTDDSELALLLTRSILRAGSYSAEEAARAYAHWLDTDPFDIGNTTATAFGAITPAAVARGDAARSARESANRESQANGSLMRVSPIGIWGHDKPADEVAAAARADSTISHPNPVCADSCAVFTVAIAHGIGSPDAGPLHVWDYAVAWAIRAGLRPPVLERLERSRTEPPEDLGGRTQGWVLLALQNAFFHLRCTATLEEAVVRTVAGGGDTDTNAAICGALMGAVHGRDAVPLQWRRMVCTCRPVAPWVARHPRPRFLWPVDALVLAERLMAAGR